MSTRRWLLSFTAGGDEKVSEEPDAMKGCPDGVEASASLGSVVFLSFSRIICLFWVSKSQWRTFISQRVLKIDVHVTMQRHRAAACTCLIIQKVPDSEYRISPTHKVLCKSPVLVRLINNFYIFPTDSISHPANLSPPAIASSSCFYDNFASWLLGPIYVFDCMCLTRIPLLFNYIPQVQVDHSYSHYSIDSNTFQRVTRTWRYRDDWPRWAGGVWLEWQYTAHAARLYTLRSGVFSREKCGSWCSFVRPSLELEFGWLVLKFQWNTMIC